MSRRLRDTIGSHPIDYDYQTIDKTCKLIGITPHELVRISILYPHGTVVSKVDILYNVNYYIKIWKQKLLGILDNPLIHHN